MLFATWIRSARQLSDCCDDLDFVTPEPPERDKHVDSGTDDALTEASFLMRSFGERHNLAENQIHVARTQYTAGAGARSGVVVDIPARRYVRSDRRECYSGALGAMGWVRRVVVPSSMGNIKVQVQWAARGGNAALYLLDGLRAQNDRNAWSFETNALDQYRNDNITLVMPVGGESSFYTDWYAPSNFNAQPITYRWETFLTRELPDFLAGYGVSPTNNAIIGLSMGGSAALNLAGHHRDQFKFAGSLSGYINISGPGMREAIRVAMFDAGRYNVDSMWGPPWSSGWLRNDPFVNAESLRGLSMYISSSNGIPGPYDHLCADRLLPHGDGYGARGALVGARACIRNSPEILGNPSDVQLSARRNSLVAVLVC